MKALNIENYVPKLKLSHVNHSVKDCKEKVSSYVGNGD